MSSLLRYAPIAGALTGLLILDWLTPLGFAIWLGYAALTFSTLWIHDHRMPWLVATVSTGLIGLGYVMSHPGIDPSVALVNRTLCVTLLWIMASGITSIKRSQRAPGVDSSPTQVRRALITAALVPAAGLLLVVGILFWQLNEFLKATQWVTHTDEVLVAGDRALQSLVDMETGLRGYLLTHKHFCSRSRKLTETWSRTSCAWNTSWRTMPHKPRGFKNCVRS